MQYSQEDWNPLGTVWYLLSVQGTGLQGCVLDSCNLHEAVRFQQQCINGKWIFVHDMDEGFMISG